MRNKIISIIAIVIVVIVTLFFTISYMRKCELVENKNIDWIKSVKIAHRGLYNNKEGIPENSLSAFKKAVENNVAIELDVQLSKDKKVVVFHDYELTRMTGISKNISDLNYIDLLDLKLLGTKEYIPTLDEVLTLVDGKVPVLIEIKNEGKVGEIEAEVYKIIQGYKGEMAIQAFNPYVLSWFRKNAPEIIRGQLSGGLYDSDMEPYKRFILSNLLLNFESKPAFISYDINYLPKSFIEKQRKKGVPVLGWTIKSNADYEKAKLNCDNIIYEEY
ncbi:glycerophosphodiester phosphodiesterase [Clostridium carnis]